MDTRKSVFDGGLYELTHTASEKNVLFADTFQDDPEMALQLTEAPLPTGRPANVARTAALPQDTLTVKLVVDSGAQKQVIGGVAEIGGKVVSRGPNVLLANIPRSNIAALDDIAGLRRAELSRKLQLRLDEARGPATRADIAAASHPALNGEGVVVGIVDSGVDWTHPDFQTGSNDSRLELFIHAHRHAATDQDIFDTFDKAQIDTALAGGGNVPQGDPNGHGTHCLSIAAGNGRASQDAQYRGVAPGATLMAVRSDSLFDTHTIEGIRRVFAAAGDRPAVVNLSLGGHIGPHDGTSALENVISKESGPGRIVVVAAGNEAQDRIHFRGELIEGSALNIEFTIRDSPQWIDVWIPRGDDVDASVIDPDGTEVALDGQLQQTAAGQFIGDLRRDQFNGDTNLFFAVGALQSNRRWTLRLNATRVLQGEVHAWAHTASFDNARNIFMSQTSPLHSIGMPATEERAISVGSFVSRAGILPGDPPLPGLAGGQISPFSSNGPTRTGVQRPVIAGPGQHVVAALASNSTLANDPRFAPRRLPGNQYISIQGTSMATPFLTGVIALMLQQEPHLTPEDIQLRLRATGQRDDDTGAVWNPAFGYGKVDVEALLDYLVVT
ncbi:subtilase family protein [Aliiruegeria haliotis]|uniref:Subtilase family protein n=1 Tax=Aliiruegeria haliotis TaxID=1280846 RepID=A0A2T0RSS2_9RHOB|nr:S8 family serine peptidase [Aliiruegeria haliotis]PRY24249.1 subtilase family protein [Aliiruegeria haliotis]